MRTATATHVEASVGGHESTVIRRHLKQILDSPSFSSSRRAQAFLSLVVNHALDGEFESLTERMIGAEMFGRPIGYDTGNDAVVRVKATEVRKKLALYYLSSPQPQSITITLPSGSYVPRFVLTEPISTPELHPGAPTDTVQMEPVPSPPEAVECVVDPLTNTSSTSESNQPSPPTIRKTRVSLRLALQIGLLTTIATCAVGLHFWMAASNHHREIRSIAILPLTNLSGDAAQEFFADGVTEEIINDLGQSSNVRVISFTSTMSYKGSKKRLPEIARELGVDAVVEGAVHREGDQVQISAQLVDGITDRPIWAHSYIHDLTGILRLQSELAESISDAIRGTERQRSQPGPHRSRVVNPEAETLYLKGLLHLNAGDLPTAVSLFQASLQKDSDSADTHAALADCFGWMGEDGVMGYEEAFTKQKIEARRAIELDTSLPAGHVESASAAMNLSWDWATAQQEFLRARALNPSSAAIYERYAVFLARTGRLAEAMVEVKKGMQIDPLSGRSIRNAGFIYYFAREYSQALSIRNQGRALDISLPQDAFLLGDVYAEQGRFADSIREFRLIRDDPHATGHLGNAYARDGQVDLALNEVKRLADSIKKNGIGRYEVALIYAGLGRRDEAFRWLEEAYKSHDEGLTNLRIDPCLDPLRDDPRLETLIQRVGLHS